MSTWSQIDPDTSDLTIKLKKDNGDWVKITDDKMTFISINEEKTTFFILTGMELKTGYDYRILLGEEHDNDKLKSNSFTVKGLTTTTIIYFI